MNGLWPYKMFNLFPPCEDTGCNQESAPQKRAVAGTLICWPPDLRLPASRTVRNEFLFLISHLACGILSEQSETMTLMSSPLDGQWTEAVGTWLGDLVVLSCSVCSRGCWLEGALEKSPEGAAEMPTGRRYTMRVEPHPSEYSVFLRACGHCMVP